MLISTVSGTAEIVSPSDDTRFYDDVGCLAADWPAHASSAHAFVRVAGGGWSDAATAAFARPAGSRTAMGSGLVAFASADAARASGADRVLTFDDLVQEAGAGR